MNINRDDQHEDDQSPDPDDVPPNHVDVFAAFVELIRSGELDQTKWAAAYDVCRVCAVAWIRHRWPRLGDQAEDVFQIACCSALRALSNGVEVPNPTAWFSKIVMNAAAKYSGGLAKSNDRELLATDMDSEGRCGFDPEAPFDSHTNEDELRKLHDAIERLKPRRRTAVLARFKNSKTYEEIAEMLRCTAIAAKILVCRGLKDLRDMLGGDNND